MSQTPDNAPAWIGGLRDQLLSKKEELTERLEKINANLRRGYDADSKERAKEFEDREVVDALGNEARMEITKINEGLQRIQSGDFGYCSICGGDIKENRLRAYPYALECIDCANDEERRAAHLHE